MNLVFNQKIKVWGLNSDICTRFLPGSNGWLD